MRRIRKLSLSCLLDPSSSRGLIDLEEGRKDPNIFGSSFQLCGCPVFPLKSHINGPAPATDATDIVDEAITFFRSNVFFRNFDIMSPADKLLIYLTFYINSALKSLDGCRTLAEGTKAIISLGLEKVPVPGESGFPFPCLFILPQSSREAGRYLIYAASADSLNILLAGYNLMR
ncbi:hypothetical protein SAY87_029203 [Trapa incisa]|uniref:Actin-related protein 2/3 complex subunit 3 n=1 Tax=Trapa incisa TaxID=236973 RepID=A0AAN7QPI2_9MYRT|nr:hypothetical protein SAY87_029203 [Trapa incisa]